MKARRNNQHSLTMEAYPRKEKRLNEINEIE